MSVFTLELKFAHTKNENFDCEKISKHVITLSELWTRDKLEVDKFGDNMDPSPKCLFNSITSTCDGAGGNSINSSRDVWNRNWWGLSPTATCYRINEIIHPMSSTRQVKYCIHKWNKKKYSDGVELHHHVQQTQRFHSLIVIIKCVCIC